MLAWVLALMLWALPALATEDEAAMAPDKLEQFFAMVVEGQVPVNVATFAENENVHDEVAGDLTVYYTLSDYMIVNTFSDDYAFSYQLAMLQADVPAGVHADDVYAMFIRACLGDGTSQADAAALVAWLREYTAQTSVYGMDASRAVNGYTVTLSTSLTQSEEILSLTRYSGLR